MKKSFILLATLLFAATSMSAQRTIKNMKFGSQTLNVTEESFVKKLEKAGWTAVEAENITLEGRINGIEVTATITPDKEKETVGKIVLFTDADSTLNATRYQVLKSWLEDTYGHPTVNDLKDEDGDISCYWGDFKKGERDLHRNNVCLTTAEGHVTIVTMINMENALDATMNNIGDAVESFGDKVNRTGRKGWEKVKEKGQKIGDKFSDRAERIADKTADERQAVKEKGKEIADHTSSKAKRIAKSAANGAKKAWRAIKSAFSKKDKEDKSNQ